MLWANGLVFGLLLHISVGKTLEMLIIILALFVLRKELIIISDTSEDLYKLHFELLSCISLRLLLLLLLLITHRYQVQVQVLV